ncbi:MAG: MerR family transcriptional regulator [Candidatus Puniceispirillaceae bacterium]
MSEKAEWAYRTISEVSEQLDVPAHVLRFWETKFTQLKPMKRSGGRRYYKSSDLELLTRIRDLLYRDGFTIKGAQKALREKKSVPLTDEAPQSVPASQEHGSQAVQQALTTLEQLDKRLDALLATRH